MEAAVDAEIDDIESQKGALDKVAEGSILQEVEAASQEFKRSLETSEFPACLPNITHQLMYASIVAQALGLSFEVCDYQLEVNDQGRRHWWVLGRAHSRGSATTSCFGLSWGQRYSHVSPDSTDFLSLPPFRPPKRTTTPR